MKLLCFSDTHGTDVMGPELSHLIPEGDDYGAVLIAGDVMPASVSWDAELAESWLREEFVPMCRKLMERCGAKTTLFIGGNHDKAFEKFDPNKAIGADDIVYLENTEHILTDEVELKRWVVYGCPQLCMSSGNAFSLKSEKLDEVYDNVPCCDVLLTHCPPYGTPMSQELVYKRGLNLMDFGNRSLRRIMESPYKDIGVVVCGHIHEGDHREMDIDGVRVVNVSYKDDSYTPAYVMATVELHRD